MNQLLNNIKNVNKLPPYPLRRITRNIETGEYYGQEVTVVPRESLLVLFPAWMSHMVTPLTKKENRYSISFACNYHNE